MKKTLFLLLCALAFILVPKTTLALTISNSKIITKSGYELTSEDYNILANYYSDEDIDQLDDNLINIIVSKKIDNKNKYEYIITDTYYDNLGNYLFSFSRSTTKDEALNIVKQEKENNERGIVNSNVHQTSSKIVGVTSAYDYDTGYWRTDVTLYWLTIPKVKSYDIIAARWTNPYFSINSATGEQQYTSNYDKVYYSYLGNNMVTGSQGVGISMNLVDSGNYFVLLLTIYSNNTPTTVYATYQHAITNISLTTSKSYTFVTNPSNGLGGVINHSYPSYFDDMLGVTLAP